MADLVNLAPGETDLFRIVASIRQLQERYPAVEDLAAASSGALIAANNLGDVANAATSRTNLGAVAKAGDAMSGLLVIQIAASNVQADYLQLKPTDFAANKPYLFIQKTTTADKWAIGLWDGSDIDGTIDLEVTTLTHNGNTIWDSGNLSAETLGYVRGFNVQTGSYSVVVGDLGKVIYINNGGSAVNLTLDTGASFNNGYINIIQAGTGDVTFVAGSGVTLQSFSGYTKMGGQWAQATAVHSGTTWFIGGNLKA